jgi:hypothetical protein
MACTLVAAFLFKIVIPPWLVVDVRKVKSKHILNKLYFIVFHRRILDRYDAELARELEKHVKRVLVRDGHRL